MKFQKFIDSILGKTATTRFNRVVILFAGAALFLFLFLNFECDDKGPRWKSASSLIEKGLGKNGK